MTIPMLTPRTLEDLIPGDVIRWLHVSQTMSFLSMTAGYVEESASTYAAQYEEWRETIRTTAPAHRPYPGMTDQDINLFLEPDLSFLTRDFPRFLRHSLVVTAYSALERHFDAVAAAAAKVQGIPLQYAKDRKSRLALALDFLKGAAIRVDIPEPLWSDVLALGRLRNRIVHEDSGALDVADCERVLTVVERCLTALYDASPQSHS